MRLFTLQGGLDGLGGFNDGLGQSSNQFMGIIHGIQAFQDAISIGFYEFLDGLSVIQEFFNCGDLCYFT